MILLGDHEPAAAVSGEKAPWDVPVHIVASRREILDRLRARARQSIQQARVQALVNVCVSGHRFDHGYQLSARRFSVFGSST